MFDTALRLVSMQKELVSEVGLPEVNPAAVYRKRISIYRASKINWLAGQVTGSICRKCYVRTVFYLSLIAQSRQQVGGWIRKARWRVTGLSEWADKKKGEREWGGGGWINKKMTTGQSSLTCCQGSRNSVSQSMMPGPLCTPLYYTHVCLYLKCKK